MRTIVLTDFTQVQVSDEDYDFLNHWRWSPHQGYARRNATIKMHKVVAERMGLIGRIDHKDQNPRNNQRENLRLATRKENARNKGKLSNNRSGFKGVSWNASRQQWYVFIKLETRQLWLGAFSTAEEGARAYDAAAKRFHGEFADLNYKE